MKYLSVCSGIEAASVAWHPLGWEPVAFSEIEPFPSAVLAHHYPTVPNLGDMTKYKEWNLGRQPDLLVGGTPCQSFSVAGLRKGLDDPRGNLMLAFGGIANHWKPRWIVWENVPGVLSSNRGRDFGSFLALLGKLGYGFAYRVLDAQYFGVAQRRRRVFVVGYLGDWRTAAQVLFESESLSGNHPPRREAGKVAPTLSSSGAGTSRTGNERTEAEFLVPVANPLGARGGVGRMDLDNDTYVPVVMSSGQANAEIAVEHSPTLNCLHEAPIVVNARQDPDVSEGVSPPLGREDWGHAVSIRTANTGANGHGIAEEVAHTLDRAQGQAVVAFQTSQSGVRCADIHATLDSNNGSRRHNGVITPMAFSQNVRSEVRESDIVGTLTSGGGKPGQGYPAVRDAMAVRRLTPRECERLQGFPDDYTMIPWKGRAAESCPDGPRYKALGNSFAVPVVRWIGERIQMVEAQL